MLACPGQALAGFKSATKGTEEEEDFHIDSKVHCEKAHPLSGTFEPVRVNPIKLAYVPCWMAGPINGQHL